MVYAEMKLLEIERKFLVTGDFKREARACRHLVQGYVCASNGRSTRVRKTEEVPLDPVGCPVADRSGAGKPAGRGGAGESSGTRAYLTIKGPTAALTRFEWETEISPEAADNLLELCGGRLIDKYRYYVPVGGHTFEVDEFHGDNEGLVVAEVELSAEDEAFERPSWLGEEVSLDPRYRNARLIDHPYKDW